MNMLLLAAFRLRFVESGCEFPTLTFFPEDADVAALGLATESSGQRLESSAWSLSD
jgi:hypothetical protein